METLYVWLLMFAGGTMVGCFLSCERELGKQRREINWLRRNHRPSEPQGSETLPSAELMTRNKELVEKIRSLSSELEESKRMMEDLKSERHQWVSYSELKQQLQVSQEIIIKLEAEQQRLAAVNFENQQLRGEIAKLQTQLQNQESAERYARLLSENAEPKQQAEEGQTRTGELEAVQEGLGTVESREMIFREQQQKLEARIKNLQHELFMAKKAVQELDATCERLAGMERVCQELREENRRLEDNISRWHVRPAAGNGCGGGEFSAY